MKSYRDLKFWDRTQRLVVRVYEVTRAFPREELVNLTAAIRRSATAMGTSIVEGFALGSEYGHATNLQSAVTAGGQLEYELLLAFDLGYLDEPTYEELTTELLDLRRQMITQLTKSKALR